MNACKIRQVPIVIASFLFGWLVATGASLADPPQNQDLDGELGEVLQESGFTGRMEEQLEERLGRKINSKLANVGRLTFFDTELGLNNDNSCAGCHSPMRGFGDTQSIAIGIDNNGIVGPNRLGPRNQRRTPMVLNTAFFPKLMWNSRFHAVSNDPFDNSLGFVFPPPEGMSLSYLPHLMTAQAFIPPTERNEMAGFDFVGGNDDIRAVVISRLNDLQSYRNLFKTAIPGLGNQPITYDHLGAALAEFQISLVFANAPIDRFARGNTSALTTDEKRGALLFFGKAKCVTCHAVSGSSNEMFSDFTPHVIGVPQIAPDLTNSTFDGPGANEDFGLEQITGDPDDRYKFRTSPLRNVAIQPTFFHNGAFTTLEEAIAHHLDPTNSALDYSPIGRLDDDLDGPVGPIEPVLDRLDPALEPMSLTEEEFDQLVQFVRTGLLDPRALPQVLDNLVPEELPSGDEPLLFEPVSLD